MYVLMCVVILNNLFLPFHNRREKKRQGKEDLRLRTGQERSTLTGILVEGSGRR